MRTIYPHGLGMRYARHQFRPFRGSIINYYSPVQMVRMLAHINTSRRSRSRLSISSNYFSVLRNYIAEY